jgi:hypothetical protein
VISQRFEAIVDTNGIRFRTFLFAIDLSHSNRPGAIDVLALPTIVFLVEGRSKLMLYKRHIAVNRQTNRDFLCFFSGSAVPQILAWR